MKKHGPFAQCTSSLERGHEWAVTVLHMTRVMCCGSTYDIPVPPWGQGREDETKVTKELALSTEKTGYYNQL